MNRTAHSSIFSGGPEPASMSANIKNLYQTPRQSHNQAYDSTLHTMSATPSPYKSYMHSGGTMSHQTPTTMIGIGNTPDHIDQKQASSKTSTGKTKLITSTP